MRVCGGACAVVVRNDDALVLALGEHGAVHVVGQGVDVRGQLITVLAAVVLQRTAKTVRKATNYYLITNLFNYQFIYLLKNGSVPFCVEVVDLFVGVDRDEHVTDVRLRGAIYINNNSININWFQ